jgi:hypothetical protein
MSSACQEQAAGSSQQKPKFELADIFREYGPGYRQSHSLPLTHLKVMRAIEVCRTAALGGHIYQCDCCGFQKPVYDSCRNRHCPKCQSLAKARWLEDRKAELLPVPYFHLVFTLPHELNPLALSNKKILYDMLFKAVSETLLEFGRTHLEGKIGFICVLHTWDQTMGDHFHLHCLVPAGALSSDQTRWIPADEKFLFSVEALGLVFRGKFLDFLKQAFAQGDLQFHGRTSDLAEPQAFRRLIRSLYDKQWVVYAKRPFSSPQQVLDYLGRYTHRVAISNNRILSVSQGRVTFSYRDRKDDNKLKQMTLDADEFIRRFLLHVLPDGFMRIRAFGFLANRSKKSDLACCRQLLDVDQPPINRPKKSCRELLIELTGADPFSCPRCHNGIMLPVRSLDSFCGDGFHSPDLDSS